MRKNLLIAADAMFAALLNCEKNTPLSAERCEQIQKLKVTPQTIESDNRKCFLDRLNAVPDFEVLAGVTTLEIFNQGKRNCALPLWRKIQRGLDHLPAVKSLQIGNDPSADEPLELNQCGRLFANLETLTLEKETADLLNRLPMAMDSLKKLQVNGPVELEWLLAIQAPNLETLSVEKIHGLESVAQITRHFPSVKKIWIGGKDGQCGYGVDEPVDLGNVGESLRQLVMSAPELGDWSSLAGSSIQEMKLMNVEFDPALLARCTQMTALELTDCLLTSEMPPLTALEELSYLVINGCMVTDYRFARGLKKMQIFSVEKNGLEITDWQENEFPEVLDCLADMPDLLEFVVEEKTMQKLLENCPRQLRRYTNEKHPDMLRLKA